MHQSSKADLQDSPVVTLDRQLANKHKQEETKAYKKSQDGSSTMLKENGSESNRNLVPVNVGYS